MAELQFGSKMDIEDEVLDSNIQADNPVPGTASTHNNKSESIQMTSMIEGSRNNASRVNFETSYNTPQINEAVSRNAYLDLFDTYRIWYKSFLIVGVVFEAIATLLLAINKDLKSFENIMFYIVLLILLTLTGLVATEKEEFVAGLNKYLSFLTDDISVIVYLIVNYVLCDWSFSNTMNKWISSLMIVSIASAVGLVVIECVNKWRK